MERGDSVLESIFEDDNTEDGEDVEMLDAEDGEIVEKSQNTESKEHTDFTDVKTIDMQCRDDNPGQKKNKKKKKKKRKRSSSGPKITDINRFVVHVCKQLKEKKSYLVWTAVGCLGISAFSDLVKEVEAIQACGGQKTIDGGRYRTGGGILWNILKARDPNAYKEIMSRGKEFEKQFKHNPQHKKEELSGSINSKLPEQPIHDVSDGPKESFHVENQIEQSKGEQKRASVHDRVRVPVAYDDLLEGEISKDQETC